MGRPHQCPRPDESLPVVCKVATIGYLRNIMDGLALPVPDDALAEVVPFGVAICEEARHWIAVRVNVDIVGLPVAAGVTGWIERELFDALMSIRAFLTGIPDTVDELFAPIVGAPLARRRIPSSRTVRAVRPLDGPTLAEEWKSGRAPFLRTIAWLDRAVHLVVDENRRNTLVQIRNRISDGYPAGILRRPVLAVLGWAVPLVGDGPRWPSMLDRLAEQFGFPFDVPELLATDAAEKMEEETEAGDSDDVLGGDDH